MAGVRLVKRDARPSNDVTSDRHANLAHPATRISQYDKKNWMEGIRKAMNERNLNEGQWEDRKQWSLGVGQCRKTF